MHKADVVILIAETAGTVDVWAVGFSIQGEAMNVAQGAHYHADVICLLP